MTLPLKWCGGGLLTAALLIGTLASVANAQRERYGQAPPTDQVEPDEDLSEPERMLRQLEESKERSDRSLARQWQGLIRQRQWVDISGKHKIFAKYLAHDPDMKWMELLKVSRSGDKTETRRVKVAIDKFGQSEQKLIKRIALIRPRVEAATAGAEEDDPAGGARFDSPRPDSYGNQAEGRFEQDEQFERPYGSTRELPREAPNPIEARPPREQRDAYGSTVVRTPRLPDFDPEQPNLADSAPWRTSFDAFQQNLSARRMGDGRWRLFWGDLTGLESAFAAALEADRAKEGLLRGELSQPEAVELANMADEALRDLGEVVWETTLPTPVYGPRAHSDYGLAGLPEPFRLVLKTEMQDGGDYGRFEVGDQVQFIGRFDKVMGEADYPIIVMRIRFPATLSTEKDGREIDQRYPIDELEDEHREYGK